MSDSLRFLLLRFKPSQAIALLGFCHGKRLFRHVEKSYNSETLIIVIIASSCFKSNVTAWHIFRYRNVAAWNISMSFETVLILGPAYLSLVLQFEESALKKLFVSSLFAIASVASLPAAADVITFAGSAEVNRADFSASATFEIDGDSLMITLRNTSPSTSLP
ncbi:MAG: hypothetical protein EOO80_07515, partial [Oxalobacteraceae bacterium]